MKKFAAFFASIILSQCAALALSSPQKSGWSFTAEPLFGVRLGQCKEIVWRENSKTGERYKLSELVYDILPALYVGVNLGAKHKRLEINFSSKFFLPSNCGGLKDSDWRNDAVYSNGDSSTKTDFSKHDLCLKALDNLPGYELELQAACNFQPASFLTLAPCFSANAQYMHFFAKNGIGWYGKEDPFKRKIASYDDENNRLVMDYDGKDVLDYAVYNIHIWAGLRAVFEPCSWARISLCSELALFSAMIDYDKHLSNAKQFVDITRSIFSAFRQTLAVEFKINKSVSICQKNLFLITAESDGKIYVKSSQDEEYSKVPKAKSGGQMTFVDLELSIKFSW